MKSSPNIYKVSLFIKIDCVHEKTPNISNKGCVVIAGEVEASQWV